MPPSSFVGVMFHVTQPSPFFPRDFTVSEEQLMYFQIRNDVETYLVTKTRFHAALAAKVFVQQKGKR